MSANTRCARPQRSMFDSSIMKFFLAAFLIFGRRSAAFLERPTSSKTRASSACWGATNELFQKNHLSLPVVDRTTTRRRTGVCHHAHDGPRFQTTTCLSMWSQDDELEGNDRIRACVPYILPLLDGDQFGHYIYERIPPLGFVNDLTISPLVNIYQSVPLLGLGLFILLTLGTRFNTDMDRNVRFNAQQAALIDVALLLPELVGLAFVEEPLPRSIVEPCNNFIWYAYMTAVGYSVFCNLRGKKPDQIPYISPFADLMVGPF